MVWGGLAYSSPVPHPSSGSKEYGRVKKDEPFVTHGEPRFPRGLVVRCISKLLMTKPTDAVEDNECSSGSR